MFPWFAIGHITPYLHISNKLARKGHKISFIVPRKTQSKIQHLNQFPQLITFVPIAVPHVDGLPPGAETTSDVPSASLIPLIVAAMDRTEHDIELLLSNLRPHIVFFDFAYWIPKLARQLGIKSVFLWEGQRATRIIQPNTGEIIDAATTWLSRSIRQTSPIRNTIFCFIHFSTIWHPR